MRIIRLWFAQLTVAILALAYSVFAIAQPYPSKPILLIVPYVAGDASDIIARIVATKLETRLGQRVIIENRAGAMGLIGFEYVAKSPPDGYTLVLGNIGTRPGGSSGGYQQVNLQKDFVPVSLLAQIPVALVVDSSIPATSVKELLDYAASTPAPLNYGTSGRGSTSYIAGQQFKKATGTTMAMVPYRSNGPALTANSVNIAFIPLTDLVTLTKSGKVRGIAVTGTKRSAAAPDIPTFVDAGVKGIDALSQYAVLLPAGTPRAIVTRLNEDIVEIVKSSDFQNEMAKLGAETFGTSPEELASILREQSMQIAKVIKAEGMYENEGISRSPTTPSREAPYKVVKVFFGTDRKLIPNATTPRDFFNNDRGQAIIYGTCEVSIPRLHKTGELEAPFVLREYFENPERHVVLMRIDLRKQNEFFNDLGVAIAGGKTSTALIFVHGYNNSFEDAARRTAQIAHDIEFTGIPMFYSWPSGGKALSYVSDGNDADQAVFHLKRFLKDVALNSGFTSITLLAHSMGNRALTRAFMALKNEIDGEKLRVFKEIILAAPDIDADVFKNEIAPALLASTATVTLYASSNDEALIASKKLNGAPRAGDSGSGLVVMKGMETIDATNVDTNLFWGLRHAYVADNRNVLSDLSYLIVKGLRAPSRYGLEPIPSPENPRYWRFKR